MEVEPYNAMDKSLILKRAKLVKENEKFSQNILTALREIARRKNNLNLKKIFMLKKVFIKNLLQIKIPHYLPSWHAASEG